MPTANTPAGAADATAAEPGAERLNTRAAGVVGLAVLCSRVLGLAREQIFAALFGGGRVMDAFTIAFRIPNLLRDLFAEGALSTAFVTVFSRTAALQDTAAAWRLADKVATLTAVSLSAITVTGIATAPVKPVFTARLGDGATFWLTVAYRLMQLPLGIFGVALGTVALPLLARMAATANTEAFRSELARGMRLTFLMTIPSSIGLMVL